MLHIECGSGTYIRSLVRDIGRALDSAATMTFLVRTRSGAFTIDEAHTIEEITDDWQSALIPITSVLGWCAKLVVIDDDATQQLSQGRIFTSSKTERAMFMESGGSGYHTYKQWLGPATRTGAKNSPRVQFLNKARTTAVLAVPESPLPGKTYKPEKVFFLDRDN
jgi:tRNA pseudouridine55 synthase